MSNDDSPWFYIDAGKAVGPLSGDDLRRLIGAEIVTRATKVRRGTGMWVTAGDLPGLFPTAARRDSQPPAPSRERSQRADRPPRDVPVPWDDAVGGRSAVVPEAGTESHQGREQYVALGAAAKTQRSLRRRRFGSLEQVANITEWLAILYVVVMVFVALGFLGMGFGGEPGGAFIGVIGAAVAFIVGIIAAIFIRATAEGIRLVLYAVELLEDIRDSRA